MKHFLLILALGAAVISFTGCSSMSSGVPGLDPVVPVVAGAVAGQALGEAVSDSDTGRIGGAIIGVIAAQQIAEQIKKDNQQQILEAYEQGKREARVEAANGFWEEKTYADGEHPGFTGADEPSELRQIQYDTRYVEGVRYGSTYVTKDQERK